MIDLKRILLPTDFSDTSLAAANYAIALAEKFSAEVHLVHVIEELHTTIPLLETYGAPTKEEYEAKAQAMLDNWPLPDGAENLTIVARNSAENQSKMLPKSVENQPNIGRKSAEQISRNRSF